MRALVLTPTRELAAQVFDNVQSYSKYLPMRHSVVFGGVKINPQIARLRGGADILVATPGRLLDLHSQGAIRFDRLEALVLDEADRMLDMGFIHDIKRVLRILPTERQNLLFSATFSPEIRQLAKGLVKNPLEIDVSPRNTTTDTVRQKLHPVDKARKTKLLSHLIRDNDWHQALVFSRTKHGANRLVKQLEGDNIRAAAIHGNKSQNARTRALADFKAGKVQILVATDIAARGIDIDQLPQVVNFDLPNVPEDYVHRIGRTGRAGARGQAVSLVSADEIKQLRDIERLIGKPIPVRRLRTLSPITSCRPPVIPSVVADKSPPPTSALPAPVTVRGREARGNSDERRGNRGNGRGKTEGRGNGGRNSNAAAGKGGNGNRAGGNGRTRGAESSRSDGQKPQRAPRRRPSRGRSESA